MEVERPMDWKTLLAYITGTVDQELLLRNESLVTENRILRRQINGRAHLTDAERKTLAEIGKKLGKKALQEVATIVKPDTILASHRTLIAQKFDGSQQRQFPGRPRIDSELEALVVRMARENQSWGYDRIVGALANLGYTISDQTVGNILKRYGIPPAPAQEKTTTWKDFSRMHLDVVWSNNSNSPFLKWLRPTIARTSACLPAHNDRYSASMELRRTEEKRRMSWKTLLAYITGSVDEELLLRHEYLVTENRILHSQIKGRVRLSDGERKTSDSPGLRGRGCHRSSEAS
jgi:Homeodomain-like domain